MRQYRASIILGLLAVLISCTSAGPSQAQNEAGYMEITVGQMSLQWKILNAQDLEIILSAPTTGWVSVGFDPSSRMKDANFILCAVVSGAVTLSDDFRTDSFSHAPDITLGGTEDVSIVGGTETADQTEVQFTIPLDSGDAFDKVLSSGNVYTVLLAYGATDSFSTKHEYRTSTQITL